MSHEALTLAHPAREVEVLKRHSVGGREGELGADFTSLEPPGRKLSGGHWVSGVDE